MVSYLRRRVASGEVLGEDPLDLPPRELRTRAVWYTVAPELLERAGIGEADVPADIHFMVIDTEGTEADVLAGLDLTRWRPWILVVEATHPRTPTPSHEAWEPDLLAAGASLLRAEDEEIGWDQLLDVEGNEFCVFAPEDEDPTTA